MYEGHSTESLFFHRGWLNAAQYEYIPEIEVVNIIFYEIVFTVYIIIDM
jgi:hypothetical protein